MLASFLPLMDDSRLDAKLTEVSTTIPIRFFSPLTNYILSTNERRLASEYFSLRHDIGFFGRNGNWDLVEDT